MVVTVNYDHADQARRRRRARISQGRIARLLNISTSTISDYETKGEALPWGLTGEDYERAMLAAIEAKRNEGGK